MSTFHQSLLLTRPQQVSAKVFEFRPCAVRTEWHRAVRPSLHVTRWAAPWSFKL
jgi:hypothetical protein